MTDVTHGSAERPSAGGLFARMSIKRKLMLISVTTSVAALATAALGFFLFDQLSFRRGLIQRVELRARLIAQNSTAAISFRDTTVATRVLRSGVSEPNVLFARTADQAGHPLAEFIRQDFLRENIAPVPGGSGYAFNRHGLTVACAVELDGERIGTVLIVYSLRPFADRLFGYAIVVAAIVILSVLAAWVASLYLQRHVSRPIVDLTRAISRVPEVSVGEDVVMDRGGDEVQRLVTDFNMMLGQIRERDAAVADYQVRLRSMASQLVLSEEAERRRIAVGLHDSICQILWVAILRLRMLENRGVDAPVAEELEEIEKLVADAHKQARSFTFQLSSPELYELGLGPALGKLIEDMQEEYGLHVRFDCWLGDSVPAGDASVLLFRAVRELLVNVYKHAGTSEAAVVARLVDGGVEIIVSDEGGGVTVTDPVRRGHKGGMGLFSIRERLSDLGGEFDVTSAPGQGTTIRMYTPIAEPSDAG